MATKLKLTTNEYRALCAAFQSAVGNGHDFGLVEEIVATLKPTMKAQAVGALVTSLQKKGVIEVHGPVITNEHTRDAQTWTQFTWSIAVDDVIAAISAYAAANLLPPVVERTQADQATIAKVVAWLNNEHGAISAQVSLPSGVNVTVFKDGTVN